jgi:shikimate kinase
MKNIILTGMPGSGKTTLGRALAERLGRTFIDADDYVEEREGRTIPELFAVSESYFRDAETRAVRALAEQCDLVVATGGGVIKRQENMDVLRQTGIVLFLDRSPDDIVSDVDVATRPLLAAGRQKVYDLYTERIELYRTSADYRIVNSGNIDGVLARILETVQSAVQDTRHKA